MQFWQMAQSDGPVSSYLVVVETKHGCDEGREGVSRACRGDMSPPIPSQLNVNIAPAVSHHPTFFTLLARHYTAMATALMWLLSDKLLG